MTTLAVALILLGLLLIYVGVKGKSLSAALTGQALDTSSGALINP